MLFRFVVFVYPGLIQSRIALFLHCEEVAIIVISHL